MGKQAPTFEEILTQSTTFERPQKLKQILAHNNRCKIWIGGSENDRVDYPYRLVPANKVTDRIRNAATELMIDSAINDPSITNETVLQKAIEYDAQWVIPKDYLNDIDKTHESILDFLEQAREAEFAGNIMFPMQPPYDKQYYKNEEFYQGVSHFAVGGVKDAKPEVQIEAVKTLREVVGPNKYIHGLGMGCSDRVVNEICTNSNFLDSMDTSTYEQLPKFGKLANKNWEQKQISLPSGESVTSLNAIGTELMVYQANYQLTDLANRNKREESPQMTLNESWDQAIQANNKRDKNQSGATNPSEA